MNTTKPTTDNPLGLPVELANKQSHFKRRRAQLLAELREVTGQEANLGKEIRDFFNQK